MTLFKSKTAEDMIDFGKTFAQKLPKRCVCYLQGDLGSGKTTWMKGVLAGLGSTETLRSPTYPIVQVYSINDKKLAHFDLYRINGDDDFLDSGLDDVCKEADYVFIEWPDRVNCVLPCPDIELCFQIMAECHAVIQLL